MRLLFISFLLIPFLGFSQKQFEFDYQITYQNVNYKDSITTIEHYLTNSRDNGYYGIVRSIDSVLSEFQFDEHDGHHFKVFFKTAELPAAEFLNIECQYVRYYKNPYKNRINDYHFIKLTDTLMNDELSSHYTLVSNYNSKKRNRKKVGRNDYVIDNSTTFHLPILTHPTAYEEWKIEGELPAGIFKEKFFINFKGEIEQKIKLVGLKKISKTVRLPKDCSY